MIQPGLVILVCYVLLILSFYLGFSRLKTVVLKGLPPKHQFSILIPFRNESAQLPELLSSILELNYQRSFYELLFIDDGSSDNSVEIITTFLKNQTDLNWRILTNEAQSHSPKKEAIQLGISHAVRTYIITTDADVILPKFWLDSFNEFISSHNPYLIVAPVEFRGGNNFLHRFQILDFYSLQGSTIGSFGIDHPFMCNAANLCYRKSVFEALQPYSSNTEVASGDDVFLLEAFIKSFSSKVFYLKSKEAIVSTNPLNSWRALIAQRQRWASKSKNYSLAFGKMVALLVLMMNAWLVLTPLLIILKLASVKILVLLFCIKLLIDFLLLFKTLHFFKAKEILKSFLSASVLYPFFVCYIGLNSLFRTYEWKGRRFKA